MYTFGLVLNHNEGKDQDKKFLKVFGYLYECRNFTEILYFQAFMYLFSIVFASKV